MTEEEAKGLVEKMDAMDIDEGQGVDKSHLCKVEISNVATVQKAVELKEMGNVFYKTKDYKKALGKYTLVQAYTRSIIPPDDKEAAAFTSATHAMEDQIE